MLVQGPGIHTINIQLKKTSANFQNLCEKPALMCKHVTKEFLHIINVVLFLSVCSWQAKAVMYKNHTAGQVQSILKMHFFCNNLVANLDVEALRRLALELLQRQPAIFVDLVNGALPVQGELPSQEQEDEPEDRDPPPPTRHS